MAQRVEDLKVWQRARDFCVAVNAIIGRPGFQRDRRLREQLRDAVDSVIANISEGFTQPTDRGVCAIPVHLQGVERGGTNEAAASMRQGLYNVRRVSSCNEIADEVARMTTGLIKYLVKSDRRDRGLGPGPAPNAARRNTTRTDDSD